MGAGFIRQCDEIMATEGDKDRAVKFLTKWYRAYDELINQACGPRKGQRGGDNEHNRTARDEYANCIRVVEATHLAQSA